MRIHFIIHESFEAPGVYYDWAIKKGHDVTTSKLYDGGKLPENAKNLDFLIVMGGPQSPRTSLVDCPHFDAQAEIELIRDFIRNNKPVIGVCLGAQLLGEAFGAKVEKSPEKEIGNFPIKLTQAGFSDKNISRIGEILTVGHWHGDMPGLTESSQVLAKSIGCPRQIVKFSKKHYGFQCHLEFSRELVDALLAEEENFEQQAKINIYVQSADVIQKYDYREMNRKLEGFLDAFLGDF